MIYTVNDAKTGEMLGQIKKYRKYDEKLVNGRRFSRTWFCLVGNEKVNADTKSNIACYLAGERKYKII